MLKTAETVKRRVLVADDSLVCAACWLDILETYGVEVVVAHDSEAVIQYLTFGQKFDLVFMDIEMPFMNGDEIAVKIRKGEAGLANASIPIVAVTSKDLSQFDNTPFDQILPKNSRLSNFWAVINRYCQ